MTQAKTELSDVEQALSQLRSRVSALRSRYGDVPAVRRLDNDLERLGIDLRDLPTDAPADLPGQRRGAGFDRSHTVVVPDAPYEPSLWHGADDEGVGGQRW